MNKILVGLIVGAVLGVIDGATAWFTPQVRDQMLGIIIGSTGKGIIAGVAAGWFARKVQSVPKGIAFGFIVGLVLAFAVAAMPDPKTGEHYWWQIMVPGSILGGVIGWATQRYGRPALPRRTAAAAVAFLAVALFSVNAQAHDGHDHAKKPDANAAFEKLKALAGTWDANMLAPDGEKTRVEYKLSANGSVVQETMFGGTPMEMITMYTVDGDAVVATHYCAGDNQPTLRLNTAKSKGDELVFDFVSVRGKNTKGHINGVTMKFGADGKVEESWSTTADNGHMKLYLNGKR
ncbi:MAG TPA: hypothetical protein VNI54_04295 [Thermoanaerobaculia bacterium]|nr:hypothetical protein [Thermoanaerobaculia bacterium]